MKASKRITICVILWTVPACAAPPLRVLNVRAAADEEFRAAHHDWQQLLRHRVDAASAIFEAQFKIRFRVREFAEWRSDNRLKTLDAMLPALASTVKPGDCDIVIGFTLQQPPTGDTHQQTHAGMTRSFSRTIIVRDYPQNWSQQKQLQTLVHELGHIFGAAHVPEQDSIMYRTIGNEPHLQFDYDNARIIRLTRDIDFHKGLRSLTQRTLGELLTSYEQILKREKDNLNIYIVCSQIHALRGEWDRAAEYLASAARLWPNLPGIHLSLAAVLTRLGRLDQASEAYHHSAKLNPKDPRPLLGLAQIHVRKDQLQQALQLLQKAHQVAPREPQVLYKLASVLVKLRRFDQARRLTAELLSQADENARIYRYAAELSLATGQLRQARDSARKAYELDKDNIVSHVLLAQAYLNNKQIPQAEAVLTRALERFGQDGRLHYLLSVTCLRSGKLQQAEQHARLAQAAGITEATAVLARIGQVQRH